MWLKIWLSPSSSFEKKGGGERFENNGQITYVLFMLVVTHILTVNIIIKVIFTVNLYKLLFYNILIYTY